MILSSALIWVLVAGRPSPEVNLGLTLTLYTLPISASDHQRAEALLAERQSRHKCKAGYLYDGQTVLVECTIIEPQLEPVVPGSTTLASRTADQREGHIAAAACYAHTMFRDFNPRALPRVSQRAERKSVRMAEHPSWGCGEGLREDLYAALNGNGTGVSYAERGKVHLSVRHVTEAPNTPGVWPHTPLERKTPHEGGSAGGPP